MRGKNLHSIATQSHIIDLKDGDQLWIEYNFQFKTDKIIYLFHGLSGSIDSSYMKRMATTAIQNNYSVVLVNHRGCGKGQNLKNKFPYHSGRGDDVLSVIEWGHSKFPQSEHIVIGYSLSGSAVLNGMIKLSEQSHSNIENIKAITVNAPLNLHKSAFELCHGRAKLYGKNFVLELKKEVKIKTQKQGVRPLKSISFKDNLIDFDEKYTAPLSGFKSASDYYDKCSVVNRLNFLKIKSYLIIAEDDPMVDFESYKLAERNNSITLYSHRHGGHLGYIYKSHGMIYLNYLEDLIIEIIKSNY